MIRYKSTRQQSLEGFSLLFGGKLNPENRWVKWNLAIPWDELAAGYYKSMSSAQGRPGKDARLVIGAVIIKHKLNLSDEETVLQIHENPYLQYFVGFSSYRDTPLLPQVCLWRSAKEWAEKFFPLLKSPRTYWQQARKRYLAISKKRNPGYKLRRKGIREQLQYLRRNFRHIEMLLDMIGGRAFPLILDHPASL